MRRLIDINVITPRKPENSGEDPAIKAASRINRGNRPVRRANSINNLRAASLWHFANPANVVFHPELLTPQGLISQQRLGRATTVFVASFWAASYRECLLETCEDEAT
jgi:hypothetical protein